MRGQRLGRYRHNLFFGAVERCSAGLLIKGQLAATVHSVALRMILFCTNGIALQLLFALYVARAQEPVFIQYGIEKDLAHNFDDLAKQRFSLGCVSGQIILAQYVGTKAEHMRISAVEVAHRKLCSKQIIEATVERGDIGAALGAAQKDREQQRGHRRFLPLYRQNRRERKHFGFKFGRLTKPQRHIFAKVHLNQFHKSFLFVGIWQPSIAFGAIGIGLI